MGDQGGYKYLYNLPTLLNKLWQISLSVTDGRHCKALCDEQFWQIEENGGKCRHIERKTDGRRNGKEENDKQNSET